VTSLIQPLFQLNGLPHVLRYMFYVVMVASLLCIQEADCPSYPALVLANFYKLPVLTYKFLYRWATCKMLEVTQSSLLCVVASHSQGLRTFVSVFHNMKTKIEFC
jgi:hypothetical protein